MIGWSMSKAPQSSPQPPSSGRAVSNSPASTGASSKPLASVVATSVPDPCFGFEAAHFEVELGNRGFEQLANPTAFRRLEAVANLHRLDGSLVSNLLRSGLPEAVPIGETRRLPFGAHIPTFAGDYEVRFGINRVGDSALPVPIPIAAEPARIEVKNTIFEAFVELINACNFRCTFCPQTVLKREQRPMDFELANKILKDLADMGHHHPIRVHLLGEPLLYPKFFEFVDAAHDLGQRISLATNGSRFSQKNIDGLLRTGLDEMVISLNTPEEELYNEQRGTRVPYEEYISGVTDMVSALVRHGGPPRTRINVLYDVERSEDPEEQARVRRIANEWIQVVREVSGRKLPDAEEVVHLDPTGTTLMDLYDGIQLQWTIYHNWGEGAAAKEHFCEFPWKHLGILVDGQATACCVDTEGEIQLGNVYEQSVEEIWNGPVLGRLREGFLRGEAVEPRCQRCDVRHDSKAYFPQ